MRAIVSLDGVGRVKEDGEETEAKEEEERVVGVVGGTEVRVRAGDWANEEAGVVEAVGGEEMEGVVVARVRARKRLHSGESVAKRVFLQEMRRNASRW